MKKALTIFVIAAALGGCTTFNRSALWNTPLNQQYATYSPRQVTVGKIYAHLYDDWTAHRLQYKQELTVKDVLDDYTVVLDIGWMLEDAKPISWYDETNPHLWWVPDPVVIRHPIIVHTIEKHNLAVNDMFSVYGQYKYTGDTMIKDKAIQLKNFVQINTNQYYTFDEPFVQW